MIFAGCPCQNNEKTMPHYLESIRALDYPKKQIHLAFLINNSTDQTYNILKKFKQKNKKHYRKITIWDITGINNGYTDTRTANRNYQYFANIRNLWLQMIDPQSKWILSVDSDILLPTHALRKLKKHNVDKVSALVLNNKGNKWNNYNIQQWNGKRYTPITNIDHQFKYGLIEVDITGACSLMKRSSIEGVKYRYHRQGEDHGFCIDLKKKGGKIYCDTTIKTRHMR